MKNTGNEYIPDLFQICFVYFCCHKAWKNPDIRGKNPEKSGTIYPNSPGFLRILFFQWINIEVADVNKYVIG